MGPIEQHQKRNMVSVVSVHNSSLLKQSYTWKAEFLVLLMPFDRFHGVVMSGKSILKAKQSVVHGGFSTF